MFADTRRASRVTLVFCLLAAWIALPGLSLAQDSPPTLADVARRAREGRQGTRPVRVYTNDDLTNAGAAAPAPAVPAVAPPANSESAKTAPAETAASAAPKSEEAWRARIARARDDLHRNEVFAEALQSRINALSGDFAARDDPFQRAQIADDRQKALEELERVKKDVESSRKAIADIEEEARRAGVPPGWLR